MLGWTDYLIDRIQALRIKELADYADFRKFSTYRNVYSAVPETFAPPVTLMVCVTLSIFDTNELC
jgi:ATP-binding cassette subfamily C (CFTR/MRP) protein 1